MTFRRRAGALTGAAVLTGGLAVGATVALPAAANAAQCSAVSLVNNCTINGTVTLGGGNLYMAAPGSLAWSGSITSQAQSLVDSSDTSLAVSDLRGSGAGWNVTAAATTFTSTSPAATLPNSGTLFITGSTTSASSTNAPGAACLIVLTCTVPGSTEPTFPLDLTTSATPTPTTVYEATTGTGQGLVGIGQGSIDSLPLSSANPFAWWVNIPYNAVAAAYASTVTMAVASGP